MRSFMASHVSDIISGCSLIRQYAGGYSVWVSRYEGMRDGIVINPALTERAAAPSFARSTESYYCLVG